MDFGGDFEGETHRCQRRKDGIVSVYGCAGEEVATFKDTDPVVSLHPLFGKLLQFGQIRIGDYDRL